MNGTVNTGGSSNLRWFTSSHSGSEGGDCVEVAMAAEAVHVRDSKDPEGPVLTLDPEAWTAFLRFVGDLG